MNSIFKKIEQLKKNILSNISSCLINIKKKVLELKNKKNDVDINLLTSRLIEEELKRETYKSKYIKLLRSTVYVLIIMVAFATLIATFFMPVFQISTSSMEPIYSNGDFVVSIKTKKLKSGDVIAFYHGNKILVKRVIAGAGDWVLMDDDGNVYVNSEKLEESYIQNKFLGDYDIKFPYQVPDGQWFVLSDDRTELIDSRNSNVGCISNEDIIGKILFRIWPLVK